jgi:voltage-gated potassium channel
MSTVGFSDNLVTTESGRVFTIFLIIISWASFAYSVSVITSHLVEGEITQLINRYRNQNHIKKMKNHTIIIGFGRNGRQAAAELKKRGSEFIIIEKSHELIINNLYKNYQFSEGDATHDEILVEAGIERASSVLITLPTDADNLFITISARSLNKTIQIISRAASDSAVKKLKIAGANEVIMPEYVGGSHMAAMVNSVDVVHFLEQISFSGDADTNLAEIICSDLPQDLQNKTINELGVRSKSGANIVGYKTPDNEFVINPSPDTKIIPNSKLFVLGNSSQINKMKQMLNLS